ncbi:glycosyltransferase family 2 protein [Naasia lichenicola]|uniref:MobA-like NTP transferase domain-containing protein n=1 Tax=Naasia lichenicola TaxID=2565933 RepID=A0A4S4FNI8_9MICO|nr:glycosyltransferase family 2 protein [Naasia lichenicola]THG30836.1 hypothetical protein E6C64_09375 [Naasia lichenicola]
MSGRLQVLMPMGGLGQRFRDAGISTPKPLIEVRGVPMFKRALASLDAYPGAKSLIVVVREEHQRDFRLADLIREVQPDAQIVMLDHDTRGAVETAFSAAAVLDPDAPLVVMDCDIAFESDEYFTRIAEAVESGAPEGLLLSFTSTDPRYSYAATDGNGSVYRTAEKDPISDNALMGAYFFVSASVFLEAAQALLATPISAEMKEYYVSLLFNRLIEDGRPVGLARGEFYSFGTPAELERFEATGLPT